MRALRFKSGKVKGFQVFAVAGTNTVSFGIRATATARNGLLGFSVERVDSATQVRTWMDGYKVFRSLIPDPKPDTTVSTFNHPVQSLVWDDFTAEPGHAYEYVFHPFKGTPANPDRTSPPISISVTTEPLTAGEHDIFFNRGVTAGQYYAKTFHNKPPEKQPTQEMKDRAYAWLSRDLDEQVIGFIRTAKKGDAIRGCFYEFTFAKVLDEFKAAIDRGVDVQLIVDLKENEHTIQPTLKNKLKKPKFVPSTPRKANLKAIKDGERLPDTARSSRAPPARTISSTTSSWCC